MRAATVAQRLQDAGIRTLGFREGNASEDGFVMVTHRLVVQVATVGPDCKVISGRGNYHFREDLDALVVDVRDALFHGSDPAAEAPPPIPARTAYEGIS